MSWISVTLRLVLRVNGQDAALILANQSPGANTASVTNKFDLDRNGRVNGQDYAILLANQQAAGIVAPIIAPSAKSSSSQRGALNENGGGFDDNSSRSAAPMPTTVTSTKTNTEVTTNVIGEKLIVSDENQVSVDIAQGSKPTESDVNELVGPIMIPARSTKKEDEQKLESLDAYFSKIWQRQ